MRGTAETEGLLREAAPRVLAALVRRFGDFADCEDAVQEAMIEAAEQWPARGLPENPTGWLVHVASRRMTDRIRSEAARRSREDAVAADRSEVVAAAMPAPGDPDEGDSDDALALILMCCHPALSQASAIALTLRAVGGLDTGEIAGAFLVPEATMGQRISRAKQTIKASAEPFGQPGDLAERGARLRAALHVLYLIFNEGYAASAGEALVRVDLSAEAIRLAGLVHAAVPAEPEATGLLALMLLTDARRPARTDAGGLVPLERQDRSLWDREAIAAGEALLAEAVSYGAVGEYQLQAAIVAVHDRAASAEATDWAEILALYGLLEGVSDNPMVALNRAIAAAMIDGPDAGLALLEELDEKLAGHHRLHSTRAHLLERRGDAEAAIVEYDAAATRTNSLPERDYLTKQAARLRASG